MQFEGIYTPDRDPLSRRFSVNEEALALTVEHLISSGVHGIIVAGSTGEYYAQTDGGTPWMMDRCAELIAGRVPMIIGTGAIRTEDSIMLCAGRQKGGRRCACWSPPRPMPTRRVARLRCMRWQLTGGEPACDAV